MDCLPFYGHIIRAYCVRTEGTLPYVENGKTCTYRFFPHDVEAIRLFYQERRFPRDDSALPRVLPRPDASIHLLGLLIPIHRHCPDRLSGRFPETAVRRYLPA